MARLLCALSLLPTSLYALHPVEGWYFGGGIGASFSSSNSSLTFPAIPILGSAATTSADVTYGVGINGIGEIGYRKRPLRFELQSYFNLNNYENLSLNGTDYPNATTDLKGNAHIFAEIINVFYDHFSENADGSSVKSFVPYIGAGIGYGTISNGFGFYQAGTEVASVLNENVSTYVYQGVIGGSMFFDDYSFGAIDLRYTTTGKITALNGPFSTITINLVYNFAFDGVKMSPTQWLDP